MANAHMQRLIIKPILVRYLCEYGGGGALTQSPTGTTDYAFAPPHALKMSDYRPGLVPHHIQHI